jgi:tRNA threonylcarbamoyladenosine biosynthesis protein TsaE
MKFISKSVNDTHKLAKKILNELILKHNKNALVVVLKGELGAGKTEFVKGLKAFLGISNNILSPTFVLMRVYKITNRDIEFKNLYHFDLYRLIEGKLKEKDIVEALNTLNVYDILNNKENIVFIEWGENIKILKEYNTRIIELKRMNEHEREIKLI